MPIDPNDTKTKPATPVTDLLGSTQLRPPPPPPTTTSNGPRRGDDKIKGAPEAPKQSGRVMRGGKPS